MELLVYKIKKKGQQMLNVNLRQIENKRLSNLMIREVWEDNFHEELGKLSMRLEKYKYIAMVCNKLISGH